MSDKKIPNEKELLLNLDKIAFTLDKAYLEHLDESKIVPFDEIYNKKAKLTYESNIRSLNVKRWVYDREEKIIDCFKNALSVFSGSNNALALVIQRTKNTVEIYFVTRNIGECLNEKSANDIQLLKDSLCGNFSGSEIDIIDSTKTEEVMKSILNFEVYQSISCLSNIPSDKSEEYISQGIDKLLNGIVPTSDDENYVILMLSDAIGKNHIRQILTGYEELATALTPYSEYQFQYGLNESKTTSEMDTLAHSEGISTSITKTHSVNLGISVKGKGGSSNAVYGYSCAEGKTENSNDTYSIGTTESLSLGTSENTSYTYKSYAIIDVIKKLEKNIERIQLSQSNGLWNCASYVLAQDAKISKNVVNFLSSLTQGDESFSEPEFIQEWSYESGNGITPFGEISKYLKYFSHPIFEFENSILVTPTAYVSTTELAKLFAFPNNSVQGVPVIGCARFGREPHFSKDSSKLCEIGCSYHMRTPEKLNRVKIDKAELTAHTFITGSTGSGKSNTVYKLLSELCLHNNSDTHFLVVEPAKGEYKNIFGGIKTDKEKGVNGVYVYGSNYRMAPLLRLNPFSFPEEIHVLEHIDRLIEIFNACWPMYAAMPAVLKEAIESSYESCGWSLTHSVCEPKRFPTFEILLKKLPEIMDSSAYSKDSKSDYTGALVTRVKSLTNGINGQIFCSDKELSNEELFDRNVIVDLSRIGSMETKSLIMGILMIKLQEHRMANANNTDDDLRHVTVLEEAHNLLRRTSSEQSQDSSNLQGKSVEMLANAIAEMRTYGEGFVIVDQAPGLLDMAVIRNTNTKIIMRLPDESDRILVGKSAGLNDEQIVELSKLDCGVAAVFQNHWLEPVLCKIDEFTDKKKFEYNFDNSYFQKGSEQMNIFFERLLGHPENKELTREGVDKIRKWIDKLDIGRNAKSILVSVLEQNSVLTKQMKQELLYRIVNGNDFLKYAGKVTDRESGIKYIEQKIVEMLNISNIIAEEIRKEVFLFAADRIDNQSQQYNDLLFYGGIK